jgi:hypothetical protein
LVIPRPPGAQLGATTTPLSEPDSTPPSPPELEPEDVPVDASPPASDPDDDPDEDGAPLEDETPLEDEEDVAPPSADPDDVPVEASVPPSSLTASFKLPSTALQATRAPTPEQTANTKVPRRVALDMGLTIVPTRKRRLSMALARRSFV